MKRPVEWLTVLAMMLLPRIGAAQIAATDAPVDRWRCTIRAGRVLFEAQ